MATDEVFSKTLSVTKEQPGCSTVKTQTPSERYFQPWWMCQSLPSPLEGFFGSLRLTDTRNGCMVEWVGRELFISGFLSYIYICVSAYLGYTINDWFLSLIYSTGSRRRRISGYNMHLASTTHYTCRTVPNKMQTFLTLECPGQE